MTIVSPSEHALREAGLRLREGALVSLPTETVYGLGANACDGAAVAAIFEAKGRPHFNPLIVHVPDLAAAEDIAVFDDSARMLADAFWPGPLTLVVPRRAGSGLSDLVTAGLDTVAVRAPDHPISQTILRHAGCPIAAPSANRSGHISSTSAQHVEADLGCQVSMIIDGGVTMHGIESTIVSVADSSSCFLLRPGAISREEIEAKLGLPLETPNSNSHGRPDAPGQLASHYAPGASVRLNADSANAGEALLAFGPNVPRVEVPTINLSPTGDLREAAAQFFASLRKLDRPGVRTIAVMPIPRHGLGLAINDRLKRAAAPR